MQIFIPLAMLLAPFATVLVAALPSNTASVGIELYSGKNCGGNEASTRKVAYGTCTRLNLDVKSGRTGTSTNGDCLITYYGSNCEEKTVVSIQHGKSGCGNYWGTVRSVMASSC